MSTIHAFQPRRMPPSRPRRGMPETATIIIFPGIRYERRPTGAAEQAAPENPPTEDEKDGA